MPIRRATPPASRWSAEGPDEALDDGVADESGVAVLVPGEPPAPRRDDEGRVADDEAEALAGDRFEEASEPQLDLGSVQGRRELREGERPLGDVGRDDLVAMGCQMQGLDATTRAEVERAADRAARRPLRDGRRGRPDADDVVRGEWTAAGDLRLVGDDPPVVRLVAVGTQVARGTHLTPARFDQPQRGRTGGRQRRESAVEVDVGHGHTETEASHQHGGGVAVVPGGQVGGERLFPVERRIGDRAEDRTNAVDGVCRVLEVRAKDGEQSAVGARRRRHPPHRMPPVSCKGGAHRPDTGRWAPIRKRSAGQTRLCSSSAWA